MSGLCFFGSFLFWKGLLRACMAGLGDEGSSAALSWGIICYIERVLPTWKLPLSLAFFFCCNKSFPSTEEYDIQPSQQTKVKLTKTQLSSSSTMAPCECSSCASCAGNCASCGCKKCGVSLHCSSIHSSITPNTWLIGCLLVCAALGTHSASMET